VRHDAIARRIIGRRPPAGAIMVRSRRGIEFETGAAFFGACGRIDKDADCGNARAAPGARDAAGGRMGTAGGTIAQAGIVDAL
jgi:hypothetical protein